MAGLEYAAQLRWTNFNPPPTPVFSPWLCEMLCGKILKTFLAVLTVSFPMESSDRAYYSGLRPLFVASALLPCLYSSVLHSDAFQRISF